MSLSDKIRAILSGLLRPYRGVPPQLQNKAARQDSAEPDEGTDGGEEKTDKKKRSIFAAGGKAAGNDF